MTFLFVPKPFMCLEMGGSSSTSGVICLSEHAPHLLHINFARVHPHSRSVQVRAFALCGHHTRSVMSYNAWHLYVVYTGYLSMQDSAADYASTYLTTLKLHLVTWTVVGLTTTKLKSHILKCDLEQNILWRIDPLLGNDSVNTSRCNEYATIDDICC
jgi:hypothetical protein